MSADTRIDADPPARETPSDDARAVVKTTPRPLVSAEYIEPLAGANVSVPVQFVAEQLTDLELRAVAATRGQTIARAAYRDREAARLKAAAAPPPAAVPFWEEMAVAVVEALDLVTTPIVARVKAAEEENRAMARRLAEAESRLAIVESGEGDRVISVDAALRRINEQMIDHGLHQTRAFESALSCASNVDEDDIPQLVQEYAAEADRIRQTVLQDLRRQLEAWACEGPPDPPQGVDG